MAVNLKAMQYLTLWLQRVIAVPHWFLRRSRIVQILIFILVVGVGWFAYRQFSRSTQSKPEYQTAAVEKGTLIVSVTASGQVVTANNAEVTTDASGVVTEIRAPNGTLVQAGDPLVTLDLDQTAKQKYSQALASYQSAKNSLDSAQNKLYTLQATMFGNWKTFYDLATNSTYQNSDGSSNETNRVLPEFHISQNQWLAAEAEYKNQQNVITQAQTALTSAWLSYQQSSPTIYAPISGEVSGLSLQVGSVLQSQGSSVSSTTTSTSQKVANIVTIAHPTVSINLTEIDVPKVKVGNNATVTIDAFPDATYTGSVLSIDTVGSTSSGVTSYPAVIVLDLPSQKIFPNMSASASIITETKHDVLLVPSSAVTTQSGSSSVQVLKNGQATVISVETGSSSDTQTEVVSGLSEGDEVITSTISTSTGTASTQSQSPFSSFGGGGNRQVIVR